MDNNRSLLLIITIVLVAILGVLVYQHQQTPGEKIQSGLNQAADGIGDAVQNAGNSLKNSTNRH